MIAWPLPRRRVRFGRVELREWLAATMGGEVDDPRAVSDFERAFARFVEMSAPAIAFPSGRAALAAVLEGLRLAPGSEVILSAYNDESVPEAILRVGLRPRFVDVEEETHNLDPVQVREAAGSSTSAILATHLFGNPCDVVSLGEIAREKGLALIEDCAHSLGVRVSGRPLGTFGHAAFFSFSATKPHSALGGGVAIAADEAVARAVRSAQESLGPPGRGEIVRAGAVALAMSLLTRPGVFAVSLFPVLRVLGALRLDPVTLYRATGGEAIRARVGPRPGRWTGNQARVGLAMLEGIGRETERRVALAHQLREAIPPEMWSLPGAGQREHGAYFFILRSPAPALLSRSLLVRGVDTGTRVMRPCHVIFRASGEFPRTDAIHRESVQIPLDSRMTEADVRRVADAIRLEWQECPALFRQSPSGRVKGSRIG